MAWRNKNPSRHEEEDMEEEVLVLVLAFLAGFLSSDENDDEYLIIHKNSCRRYSFSLNQNPACS